jgi:hypothetical protein
MEIKVFGNSRSVYYAVDMLYDNSNIFIGRILNDTVIYEIASFIENNIRKHELQDPEGDYDKRIGISIFNIEDHICIEECGEDGN